jgi:glycosyltransferase involved in cell wall biosynthesis
LIARELGDRVATLEQAAGVIAVSQHVKQSLPVDHCRVIPNLVDLADIERRLVGEPIKDLPERFVFFAGKLEPNKAPDRLTPVVRASGVRVPLVVAGNGSLETSLKEDADQTGEEERFIGWVEPDKVLRLMRRAAAVLFPSRWDEPLSRVLLEGLAVGAVLIVEPTGGSGEIVVHEESGLIGQGVEALGSALARVLEEDGLAARLRQGARRRAKEHFSAEVVLPRVEDVYERLAKGERLRG